jgi:hypothetical protein
VRSRRKIGRAAYGKTIRRAVPRLCNIEPDRSLEIVNDDPQFICVIRVLFHLEPCYFVTSRRKPRGVRLSLRA